jgi:hypothetical protein
MDSKNLNVGGCGHAVGSCGRAVGGQGVSWKGRDQSRNNWDGSNLSSGGWATAREVGDAAKAVAAAVAHRLRQRRRWAVVTHR